MINRRKHKTLWLCLLIGSLSILPTSGHTKPALNGAELLELCISKLTIPETQCLSFISGVMAGHPLSVGTGKTFYCFPETPGAKKTRRVIVKYLKKNAGSLDRDAAELIFLALADTWPCRN